MTKFETISTNKNTPDDKDTPKISRRAFLKGVGVLAVSGIVDKAQAQTKLIDDKFLPANPKEAKAKLEEIRKHYETPTKTQMNIEKQDTHVIGKTFREQIIQFGKIKLDEKTRQVIYNHHYTEYSPGGKNYEKGLVAGLKRMQPWFNGIREQFKKYNVPEKFIYLSIAESNFNMDAVSNKAAIGPFQITKDTAQLSVFNMSVSKYYDERRDPIRSAELCAKHLRKSFDKFFRIHHNSEEDSWKLALMDYNGGYINKYAKYLNKKDQETKPRALTMHVVKKGDSLSKIADKYNTSVVLLRKANFGNEELTQKKLTSLKPGSTIIIPQERTPITFAGFNQWLETRINAEISQILSSNSIEVKSGDTLSGIAKKYNSTVLELQTLNNLPSTEIKLGQKLKVPLTKNQKVDLAINKISGYSENINYPEKFYAIYDVIKEQDLETKLLKSKQTYIEIPISKTTFTQKPTLNNIAKRYKVSIQKLKQLNPAIRFTNVAIPKKIKIRIPT